MISKLFALSKKNRHAILDGLLYFLVFTSFALGMITYFVITRENYLNTPDPSVVITIVLIDLLVLLTLCVVLGRKLLRRYKSSANSNARLYTQLSLMCALVSFVPTIIISLFSAYFFNFGIQAWFNKRIDNVLEQSVSVAQAYMAENSVRMKGVILSLSVTLGEEYYVYLHRQEIELFNQKLNDYVKANSLSEALVFKRSTRTTIAQSSLSFFSADIPDYLLDKAEKDEVVDISNDKKIRYLVKLPDYEDVYLIIGRVIEPNIIKYMDKAHGAISSYNELKNKIKLLQLNFSIIFILVAIILLLTSFYVGVLFADKLVQPINKLVLATDKVKNGDLTVQIVTNKNNNEIDSLVNAFNMMVKRLYYQQKDLLVAQKALAWSEVARRVAHEINNPLTSIYLSCDRLSKKFGQKVDDQESFNKYINNIFRLSESIKVILGEFVNFARLPDPVFNKFELIDFVSEIMESRAMICEDIEYNFNSSIKSFIFNGDANQIQQVLINLLKNSEESITENHKTVRNISLCVTTDDQMLFLELNDTGVGFALNDLEKLTEAYFTTRVKGTGLGLAVVKKIIQDHNGTLIMDNNPQGGAKITIAFYLDGAKSNDKSTNDHA